MQQGGQEWNESHKGDVYSQQIIFFPYFGSSQGFVLNSFNIKKKKKSIFKWHVTVSSAWIGKGESSAMNSIYNIAPGTCKKSRRKFCTAARGFVTFFRSQV